MTIVATPLVTQDDTFALTPKGEAEIRGAKTTLSPLALELLVRIDGQARVSQLDASVSGGPLDTVLQTLGLLLRDGLICYTDRLDDLLRFDEVNGIAAKPLRGDASVARAQREAAKGLDSLQREGYYVRIARRPAGRPTLPSDRAPAAVIVEDEPHLARFLSHLMRFEGFEVRVGSDRDTIVQALRASPRPDLILLDVMLPDVNGFDILSKIREHPVLHEVPVVMLTSIATREAVLKGLTRGADGYVTKPFQLDVLVQVIQTIFGLAHDPAPDPWSYA